MDLMKYRKTCLLILLSIHSYRFITNDYTHYQEENKSCDYVKKKIRVSMT